MLKLFCLPSEAVHSRGSKFFPFRVDIFSEGLGVQESKQEVTKVVSLGSLLCLKYTTIDY